MKLAKKICLGLMASAVLLPNATTQAAYSNEGSDTGVEAFDYLENQHRTERLTTMTDEQKALVQEVLKLKASLKYPIDPKKAAPVSIEGDDLMYDQRNGDFSALGKVRIVQLDAHEYDGQNVSGNLNETRVNVDGNSHMLQVGQDYKHHVTMDGLNIRYNYGTHIGTMDAGHGKVGVRYVVGKRFEFYPDHYVVYNGIQTPCSAKNPDFSYEADRIEIWPDDKIIMNNVRFKIKGKTIYHRDRLISDLKQDDNNWPKLSYDSDDGLTVSQDFTYHASKQLSATAELKVTSNRGIRNKYDITWSHAGNTLALRYGQFEDSNNYWLKKEPSFEYRYKRQIEDLPVNYGLRFDWARWSEAGVVTNVNIYGIGLDSHVIPLPGRMSLKMSAWYLYTREVFGNKRSNGIDYHAVLTKEFNDKYAMYLGYRVNNRDTRNSSFHYGVEDYQKRIEAGLSYRMDKINRFVVASRYAIDFHEFRDIDYYWYHDMHCAQMILQYRSKRDTWKLSLQFTPW